MEGNGVVSQLFVSTNPRGLLPFFKVNVMSLMDNGNIDPNPNLSFRDVTMTLMITVNLDPNPNLDPSPNLSFGM